MTIDIEFLLAGLPRCLKRVFDQNFAEFLSLIFRSNAKRTEGENFFPFAVFILKPVACKGIKSQKCGLFNQVNREMTKKI